MPLERRTVDKNVNESADEVGGEDDLQDTISKILDPNNTEPIVLYGEDGKELKFEQVALVPLDEELYVVLKPLTKLPGINADEAIVFMIDYDEEETNFYLNVETDQEVIDEVFKVYSKLFDDAETTFEQKVEEGKNS